MRDVDVPTVIGVTRSPSPSVLCSDGGSAARAPREGRRLPQALADPSRRSESAPELHHVLDLLSVGVVIVGADGSTVYRNPAARSLAGTHSGLLVDDTVRTWSTPPWRGESRRETLELYGPPRLAIVVAAAPLPWRWGDGVDRGRERTAARRRRAHRLRGQHQSRAEDARGRARRARRDADRRDRRGAWSTGWRRASSTSRIGSPARSTTCSSCPGSSSARSRSANPVPLAVDRRRCRRAVPPSSPSSATSSIATSDVPDDPDDRR